jgi:hypothetical protein
VFVLYVLYMLYMRAKRSDLVEFNVFFSLKLYARLQQLQEAGLGMSALARLAVRKCADTPLDDDNSDSTPKRVLLYLHPKEAAQLELIAARYGERSKGLVLRRLIFTYLRVNAAAIEAMF